MKLSMYITNCQHIADRTSSKIFSSTVTSSAWYRGGSPTAVRPSEPALCGSCPLVTPYYCRLGDLLCFVFIVRLVCFSVIDVLYVSLVLWYCWLGLLTCKNRRPYNLYCVGGDVKPCSINQCWCAVKNLLTHCFWSKYRILKPTTDSTVIISSCKRHLGRYVYHRGCAEWPMWWLPQ